jgi:hypothetical protein
MVTSTDASMLDSVANSELSKLGQDIVKLTLDEVLDDEFVRSVPIVGFVAKFYKSAVSIRDRVFLLKVISFLHELEGVPRQDRERFVEELAREAGSSARAGAALTLALDRYDDLEKPKIAGRFYRAKIEGRISFQQLWRYCMIVDRAHLPDLIDLSRLKDGEHVNPLAGPYLQALGVVTLTGEDIGTFDGIGAKPWFEVSDVGSVFLSIAFSH